MRFDRRSAVRFFLLPARNAIEPLSKPAEGVRVQGFVYIFTALVAAGILAAAWYGVVFSPVEALVTIIAFGAIVMILVERRLYRRAEARLALAIDDVTRLVASDARMTRAGAQDASPAAVAARLEALETEIRTLQGNNRRLAGALHELQEHQGIGAGLSIASHVGELAVNDDQPGPTMPVEDVRRAMTGGRLVFHLEPVVALPARQVVSHDLVPRIEVGDGSHIEREAFLPRRGEERLLREIEHMALDQAVTIARRSRTNNVEMRLNVPFGHASIHEAMGLAQVVATLDANRAVAPNIRLVVPFGDWLDLDVSDRSLLGEIRKSGAGFVLDRVTALDSDVDELASLGFTTIRLDAARYLSRPESFGARSLAELVPAARRLGIAICATGVAHEQQLPTLFSEGIEQAQGPHIGRLERPAAELLVEREQRPA